MSTNIALLICILDAKGGSKGKPCQSELAQAVMSEGKAPEWKVKLGTRWTPTGCLVWPGAQVYSPGRQNGILGLPSRQIWAPSPGRIPGLSAQQTSATEAKIQPGAWLTWVLKLVLMSPQTQTLDPPQHMRHRMKPLSSQLYRSNSQVLNFRGSLEIHTV